MLPILRALKDRLLNEPTFFLYACSAAAVVVADQVNLPVWAAPAALAVFGLANRAVVVPAAKATAQRRRAVRAARSAKGQASAGLVVFVLAAILLVLFLKAATGSWLVLFLLLALLLAFVF